MILQGILYKPNGTPYTGMQVRLTAVSTSGNVLEGVYSFFDVDATGHYNFDCPVGTYVVAIPGGNGYTNIGQMRVTPFTPLNTSITTLLMADQDTVPRALYDQVVISVTDAVTASQEAAAAATGAQLSEDNSKISELAAAASDASALAAKVAAEAARDISVSSSTAAGLAQTAAAAAQAAAALSATDALTAETNAEAAQVQAAAASAASLANAAAAALSESTAAAQASIATGAAGTAETKATEAAASAFQSAASASASSASASAAATSAANATASENAAYGSASAAVVSALESLASGESARASALAAIEALDLLGITHLYVTHADCMLEVDTLPEGDMVRIIADETRSNRGGWYYVYFGATVDADFTTDYFGLTDNSRLTLAYLDESPKQVAVPLSSAAPGQFGDFAVDSTHAYFVTGASQWKRITLETF